MEAYGFYPLYDVDKNKVGAAFNPNRMSVVFKGGRKVSLTDIVRGEARLEKLNTLDDGTLSPSIAKIPGVKEI